MCPCLITSFMHTLYARKSLSSAWYLCRLFSLQAPVRTGIGRAVGIVEAIRQQQARRKSSMEHAAKGAREGRQLAQSQRRLGRAFWGAPKAVEAGKVVAGAEAEKGGAELGVGSMEVGVQAEKGEAEGRVGSRAVGETEAEEGVWQQDSVVEAAGGHGAEATEEAEVGAVGGAEGEAEKNQYAEVQAWLQNSALGREANGTKREGGRRLGGQVKGQWGV